MKLRRALTIVAHSADIVELRSGVWNQTSVTLSDEEGAGKLLAIVEALRSERDFRELAKDLGVSRSQIEAVADQLVGYGLMETHAGNALDHYLDLAASTLTSPINDVQPKAVTIIGGNPMAEMVARLVSDTLGAGNVELLPPDHWVHIELFQRDMSWLSDSLAFEEQLRKFEPYKDRVLCLVLDVVDPFVGKKLNRLALGLGASAHFAMKDGPFLFVGPSMDAGKAACFECFETRVMLNLREYASYQKYKNALARGQVRAGMGMPVTPIDHLLASHSAMEIINLAVTGSGFTVNKVLGIYLPTMEISFNEVLRVAHCPACGAHGLRHESEIYFDLGALLSGPARPAGTSEA